MNNYYKGILDKIEEQILKSLPLIPSSTWKDTFYEKDFQLLCPSYTTNIHKPGREIITRGGKRWRPFLMYLAADTLGKTDAVLDLSPLVEIPHTGTLIVDDIEDSSPERRGGKAAHLIYGQDMAINTGNYMYFLPTSLIDQAPLSDTQKLKLYQAYSSAMRRLHVGQGLDIQWHTVPDLFPTTEEYLLMCKGKTGSLSRFAAEAGAIIGGANVQETQTLSQIWEEIGVAFQILDDVLNLSRGNPGKMKGDDLLEGKKSLPVILFAEKNDPTELVHLLSEINEHKDSASDKLKKLVSEALSLLSLSGALDEARIMAEKMIKDGISQLEIFSGKREPIMAMQEIIQSFWDKMS